MLTCALGQLLRENDETSTTDFFLELSQPLKAQQLNAGILLDT